MPDKKYPTVMLVTPSLDGRVSVELVQSLMALKNALYMQRVHLRSTFMTGNSILFNARNQLMDDFLKSDADVALLVDSDISFRPEDVVNALPHLDNGIIGFPCSKKFPKWERAVEFVRDYPDAPAESIVALLGDANFSITSDIVRPDDNGLVKVDWIGTGMMLVSRGALDTINKTDVRKYYCTAGRKVTEFFKYEWDDQEGGYSGEDVSFCNLARSCGVPLRMKIDAATLHTGFVNFVFNASIANKASKAAKKKA